MARVTFLLALAALSASCERVAQCPTTVDQAQQIAYDDEIAGGGYAIRYVTSENDPSSRGYDVNLTRPASERAQLTTYFLRVEAPIPGIVDGKPVLLMAERTDRTFVVVPGACAPLTPTTEDDVTRPPLVP